MSAASATHTEVASAPFELVARLLEEKVYHPERSIATASDVRILRDGGGVGGVERKMFLSNKGPSGADVHELITWSVEGGESGVGGGGGGGGGPRRMLVTFLTLTDALTSGTVTNLAVEDPATRSTSLTYTMRWDWRDDAPAAHKAAPLFADAGAVMRGAVAGMKSLCEAKAAEELAAAGASGGAARA
jgi:hypothetical protein